MGRLSRFSRHVTPPVVIFAQGLHQKTCQLLLEPAVSSGTPQTFPLLPRTPPPPPGPARPDPAQPSPAQLPAQPSDGTPSPPSPARCLRAPPLLRPEGTRPGRARDGRAARGGSHDNTTALTLPRGPPAAGGGGRALPADVSPSRSRQAPLGTGPAHDTASGGRKAGVSRGGRRAARNSHTSSGGSGILPSGAAERRTPRAHAAGPAGQHSTPTVGEPRCPLRAHGGPS